MYASDWQPYEGEYEKEFYDVRTFEGREYYQCWPNDGNFHARDREKTVIRGEEVKQFRLYSSLD